METNVIYNEDCLETLKRMEDNSIDLVVTSPPYNKNFYAPANVGKFRSETWSNLNGRQIPYDIYKDDMKPEDYENWQIKVISECLRVLKPTGSLFYNHKDIIYNGRIIPPKWVYNFPIHQQLVWDRQSSPAIDVHYFIPAFEYIYWFAKDSKQTIFDRDKSYFKTAIFRVNFEKNPHPAPFPMKLINSLIASCTPPPVGNIRSVYGKWHNCIKYDKRGRRQKLYRERDFPRLLRNGGETNKRSNRTTPVVLIE